jgi:hypothetical protein
MILFALLTYGVPVLLIREMWVAGRLPMRALWVCGLAYGIFNEGIMARTLEMSTGLPIPTFDQYMVFAGINWSWGLTMLVWHAVFSVAAPIMVVHWLNPEQSRSRWLSRGEALAALCVVVATSALYFSQKRAVPPSLRVYLGLAATIAALVSAASRWRSAELPAPWRFAWADFAAGAAFFAFFGGLFAISSFRYSPIFFLGFAGATLMLAVRILRAAQIMENGALLFCLGNCAAYSTFVFVAKLRTTPEGIVTTLIFVAGYCAVLARA